MGRKPTERATEMNNSNSLIEAEQKREGEQKKSRAVKSRTTNHLF